MTVDEPVADILARLEGLTAEQVLADAAARYAGRIAFFTTFGAEDQVVTHMIAGGELRIPIFTVDTGRLLPETHDLIEQTSARYGVRIAVYSPNSADVELMVQRGGINLFRNGAFERGLCCEARKTKPLRRAQVGLDAWVCISRDERGVLSDSRELAAWDTSTGLVTIDPLAAWDDAGVWDYVRAHDVPYNPLHDQGFETVYCAPCARRT